MRKATSFRPRASLAIALLGSAALAVVPAAAQATPPAGSSRPAVPRHALRGGGPSSPMGSPCAAADRTSHGDCVAPDLAPSAPQRGWDRDPRQTPATEQNDPGPSVINPRTSDRSLEEP